MARKIKYYLVAAEALPEIFIRVAEAKRMMQTGEADTVGAATKMAGISRSAFYKYKDAVQPFNDMKSEHIITFYTLLKDVSGTLSSVLGVFAASGANILTINQSIPTNGCAAVTISAETSAMEKSLEQLITDISALDNVIKFEILAGQGRSNDDQDRNSGVGYSGDRCCEGSRGQHSPHPAQAGPAAVRENGAGPEAAGRPVSALDDREFPGDRT